jgi:hypothetical protein
MISRSEWLEVVFVDENFAEDILTEITDPFELTSPLERQAALEYITFSFQHSDKLPPATTSRHDAGYDAFLRPKRTWIGLLSDTQLSQRVRVGCIRSMSDLYRDYVMPREAVTESFTTVFHMWWEELFWWPREANATECFAELSPESRHVLDEVLNVLRTILTLDSDVCVESALHGLNHILHPRAPHVIQAWMESYGSKYPTLLPYALQCLRREAL